MPAVSYDDIPRFNPASMQHIITNARIVTADDVFIGSVVVESGRITDVDRKASSVKSAEDWGSDYLVAGLVELHTDNLEKHLEPRPGVRWPAISALLTHDAQVSTAGITTVLDSMGVGDFDERSIRASGLQAATDALNEARSKGLLRAEHLLHMRCEIACDNVVEVVEPFLDDPTVRLVSLMDHTPGQRQWMNIEKFRTYTQRNQKWSDEYLAEVVQGRLDMQARNSDRNRLRLLALCNDRLMQWLALPFVRLCKVDAQHPGLKFFFHGLPLVFASLSRAMRVLDNIHIREHNQPLLDHLVHNRQKGLQLFLGVDDRKHD